MTDLKNYRAPRNWWAALLGLAVAIAALTFVGPTDFAYQLDLEAQNKALRAELAAARKPRAHVAPIRPTRLCGDRPFIAWQADGGRWDARCTPSADFRGKP